MKPLVIFLLLFSPFLSAETLHDILARNRIPIVGFTKREMDDEISSSSRHIVGDNLYLIMQVDRNGAPSPYMYVVRYGPVKPMLTETRLKAVSAECFGSVLDVKEMARSVLIVTHINPSASCTIALDANTLRPQKTFMGWPDAYVGTSGVILEEDQVHFAPVHPLRLRLVDLVSGKDNEVFPPDGDPLRESYSSELKKHLPSERWCAENNNPCDPANFEQELRFGPETNVSGDLFGFLVSYETQSFGDEADAKVGTWFALYIYRKSASGWEYCERKLADAEVDDVGAMLKANFDNLARTCTEFHKTKVSPIESPFSQFELKTR